MIPFLRFTVRATLIIPALLSLGCGDDEPARPSGGGVLGALAIPRRLRRLSAREYNNAVADLLGMAGRPADAFVHDVYPNGFDNGAVGLVVQSDQAAQYQQAAEALAESAVTTAWGRLAPGCDPGQHTDDTCFDAFVDGFAPRAYRRPLTNSERDRLRVAYRAGATNADGAVLGVQTALEAVLQSPQFLYREELGAAVGDGSASGVPSGVVTLTDYEAASQLSFLLTGSIPDDALWTAVQAGAFRTADDRLRHAARLLATPAAPVHLRGFLHQWFATDRLDGLTKDARVYPAFSGELAASMKGELDRFFDDLLTASDGSLRQLFSSRRSFVDQRLASLYSVGGLAAADGFVPTLLDDRRRGGVLARAGYLAVHADTDSSGPIARGVFLMQALLCTALPPPPPNVPLAPRIDDPDTSGLTTRQRFERHVRDPACRGCHDMIDGFGFGFEEFDGIGAARQQEGAQAVDASGHVTGTVDADGAYQGLASLAARLAGSRSVLDCFARQSYRFAMGDVEPPALDHPAIKRLAPAFSADRPLADLLMAFIADPGFVTRKVEEGTAP